MMAARSGSPVDDVWLSEGGLLIGHPGQDPGSKFSAKMPHQHGHGLAAASRQQVAGRKH